MLPMGIVSLACFHSGVADSALVDTGDRTQGAGKLRQYSNRRTKVIIPPQSEFRIFDGAIHYSSSSESGRIAPVKYAYHVVTINI